MTLAELRALWGLLLVPLLAILLALDGQRRRRALERIGHLPQIRKMTASVSVGRRRLKAGLFLFATAALVLSLARPERLGTAHMLPHRGLEIVVALDFSRSMLAADVFPTRLDRARFELGQLIDGLKGDRVGLVAFAGVTLSYPLTSDYAAARLFWRDLAPEDMPKGGTDLGQAIRASLELFKFGHHESGVDNRRPAQVLVLLTDGADTENQALDAANDAAKAGVKIYSVGIGSRDGEVVVLKKKDDGSAEYITDVLGSPQRMVLDEGTLREIARRTGGEYFPLDAERFGVERVEKAIEGLSREEDKGRIVTEPEEVYWWFALGAFLLLVVEALVRERRRAVKPTPLAPGARGESEQNARPLPGTGRRRRAVGTSATTALLVFLLPALGGWSWLERLSPDVEEGNEKLAAGRPDEALAAYDRALAASPDDLAIHYDRGAALFTLGRLPEAQREFQRAATSTDPALRADAFYNQGNALLKQTRPSEAIGAYKSTLRLRPDDRRAKWNLELALKMLEGDEQEKEEQRKKDQQLKDNQNQPSGNQQSKDEEQKQDPPKQGPPQDQQEQDQKPGSKPETRQDFPKPDSRPDPKQAQGGTAQAASHPARDTERRNMEHVLDTLEHVEPTVQKELAKKKAMNVRPRKDW